MNRPSGISKLLDERGRFPVSLGSVSAQAGELMSHIVDTLPSDTFGLVRCVLRHIEDDQDRIDMMRFLRIEDQLVGKTLNWYAIWTPASNTVQLEQRDDELGAWLHLTPNLGAVQAAFIGRMQDAMPQIGIWAQLHRNDRGGRVGIAQLGYVDGVDVLQTEDAWTFNMEGGFSCRSRLTYEIPLRHPAK